LITINLPDNVLGDYHLQTPSGAVGIGAHTSTAPSGATVTRPVRDIDGDLRPVNNPDAGADQLQPAPPPPPGVTPLVIRPGGGGRFFAAGLFEVKGPGPITPSKPAPSAPTFSVPAPTGTAPTGRSSTPRSQVAVPVAPPAGSVANVVQVGSANPAGNTAVLQVFGAKAPINGTQQAQPTSNQAASVPGGAKGGGHFTLARHRHGSRSQGGFLTSPYFIIVLIVGAAVWLSRRRKRRPPRPTATPPTGFNDPPSDTHVSDDRQLAFAGKGDRS
jgi:hypothetical protein